MSPDAEACPLPRVSAPINETLAGSGRTSASVLSAGLLWGMAILIPNIMPVVFQALQRSAGLTEGQLGGVGAAFVLGGGLVSVAGPFWVRRVNVRNLSLASLLVTTVALLLIAQQRNATAISLGWFVVGAATGGFGTPAFAALGDTANPVRTYSLALFASSVLAAGLSFGLPLVVLPRFGGGAVIIALAVLFAAAIPCVFVVRGHRRQGRADLSVVAADTATARALGRTWREVAAPVLACVAGAVFTGVIMGAVYNFVGAFAAAAGIDGKVVGLFVGAALLSSLVGSLAPSFLGKRFHPAAMIGVSALAMLLTYPGLSNRSSAIFGVCFAVNMAFSTFGYTYFLALVRALDPTDRIYIAYPAAMSLGTTVLTAGAGAILSHHSPALLLTGAASLVAASLAVALTACWLAPRTRRGAELVRG